MSVSISTPAQEPTSTQSASTPIPASVTATFLPANPDRKGGLITNKGKKSIWVKFGDPSVGAPLVAADPFIEVPAGGNCDIFIQQKGMIGIISAAPLVANPGSTFIVEYLP
jgi:hypothetical protein